MSAKVKNKKVDIASNFHFDQWSSPSFFYKRGAGYLGVPGTVITHRDEKIQETLSRDTGEHAGHLIGIQFGAPGGIENLGLQKRQHEYLGAQETSGSLARSGRELLKARTEVEIPLAAGLESSRYRSRQIQARRKPALHTQSHLD